jgi:hypothetical protein
MSYYPLDRPLPPDVAAGEAAFIHFYQKYAAFSWPWARRRTLAFGAFTALAGITFGVTHGLTVKSVSEVFWVGGACALANVILVGAGPMLAAGVRQAQLPRRVEGLLLVAAVLAGMAIARLAGDWASMFHDHFMAAHQMGGSKSTASASVEDLHRIVRRLIDSGYEIFVLFIANGGLALATYFAEPKRWAEHLRRVELEKASLQKAESDLKLTVLQAQVEPHFLFNTLASVRSLIASDPQRAAQTIDALALHLRATLPKFREEGGMAASTLGEQFAICESYLELMKVRLGDRLRVDIHLPENLRDLPFPPLLLISLVENAITHGVEPKPGASQVTLAARAIDSESGRQLEVRVEDDGAGLKVGMGEGTGLANVRAQLRTRFGAAASLDVAGRFGGGVLARMILPIA